MLFLIADDSENSLNTLRRIITDMGHEVVATAGDGQSAVAQYRTFHPDVTILDLIMPRMNGREALRAILALDPDARVVMASAMRSPQNALDCQREGASFFVYKPYDVGDIRNVINKLKPRSAKPEGGQR